MKLFGMMCIDQEYGLVLRRTSNKEISQLAHSSVTIRTRSSCELKSSVKRVIITLSFLYCTLQWFGIVRTCIEMLSLDVKQTIIDQLNVLVTFKEKKSFFNFYNCHQNTSLWYWTAPCKVSLIYCVMTDAPSCIIEIYHVV